jgi:hypothetical protein
MELLPNNGNVFTELLPRNGSGMSSHLAATAQQRLYKPHYEGYSLVGSNAVWFEENPTFRMNTLPPSLGPRNNPRKKPTDIGDMFLRNVGLSTNYTTLNPEDRTFQV